MSTFARAGRILGALEEKIMDLLWASSPRSVRDAWAHLGKKRLAYTTVMTTMDRLFKKGLLEREKQGNAFVYRAAMSREEYNRRIVEAAVSSLLEESADPVLAAFVDVAARADEKNLARLERLIEAHRRRK